ncbi:hypothetical protein PAEN110709_03225 [Paenibacillus endophyticus]
MKFVGKRQYMSLTVAENFQLVGQRKKGTRGSRIPVCPFLTHHNESVIFALLRKRTFAQQGLVNPPRVDHQHDRREQKQSLNANPA